MIKRLAMAGSVLIRMGSGLVAFILIARGLGPEAFGLVATVFAYATLVSLATDFGFGSKALRDMAAEPERGGAILNACLNLKAILTLAALVIGGVAIWLSPKPPGTGLPMAMLGAAVLIGAIGDLALTAYRATGKYIGETVLIVWTSTFHVAVVGWVTLAHGQLLWLAVAFLVSRIVYTCVAVIGAERLFAGLELKAEPLSSLWANFRGAWAWAVDSGLNYLSAHIDGLVVVAIFGLHGAGIYQAGGRFNQAALAMIAILANIHVPQVSRKMAVGQFARRDAIMVILEFSAAGAVMGAVLWLGGPLITRYLLGSGYSAVNSLWFGFGAFVFARYVAAGAGMQLAAIGKPLVRIIGQLPTLFILAAAMITILPRSDISLMPWIMTSGALVTTLVYMFALVRSIRHIEGQQNVAS